MAHMTQVMELELINYTLRGYPTVFAGLWSSSATAEELRAGETTNRILLETQEVTFGAPVDEEDGSSSVSNTNLLEWEDMPASTVGFIVLNLRTVEDPESIEVPYCWIPLDSPVVVGAGDTFRVDIGDLKFKLK